MIRRLREFYEKKTLFLISHANFKVSRVELGTVPKGFAEMLTKVMLLPRKTFLEYTFPKRNIKSTISAKRSE